MRRIRKLVVLLRDYVRHDVREIIAPRSLPDPPDLVLPPRRTPLQWLQVIRHGTREYIDSWRPSPPPKTQRAGDGGGRQGQRGEGEGGAEEEAALRDELTGVLRGGADAARPYLQRMYQARAQAYRDAMREFVAGYREGLDAAEKGTPLTSPFAPQGERDDAEGASSSSAAEPGPPAAAAISSAAAAGAAGSGGNAGRADGERQREGVGMSGDETAPPAGIPAGEQQQQANRHAGEGQHRPP